MGNVGEVEPAVETGDQFWGQGLHPNCRQVVGGPVVIVMEAEGYVNAEIDFTIGVKCRIIGFVKRKFSSLREWSFTYLPKWDDRQISLLPC